MKALQVVILKEKRVKNALCGAVFYAKMMTKGAERLSGKKTGYALY